jgi:hypothetical protein
MFLQKKLSIGKKMYCAKRFYSVEDSESLWVPEEPSLEENERHLQEELIRHYPIREALTNFLAAAQRNKIAVHGKFICNVSPRMF